MAKQLREWRGRWRRRLVGGWLALLLPAVVVKGDNGMAIFLFGGLAALVGHTLIQARLLSAVGERGRALFYRIVAGYFALVLVVGCVMWLL